MYPFLLSADASAQEPFYTTQRDVFFFRPAEGSAHNVDPGAGRMYFSALTDISPPHLAEFLPHVRQNPSDIGNFSLQMPQEGHVCPILPGKHPVQIYDHFPKNIRCLVEVPVRQIDLSLFYGPEFSEKAVLCQDGKDEVEGSATLKEVAGADTVKLEIRIRGLKAELYAGDKKLGEANVKNLSTEVAGGFVGCTVGLYANAGGSETSDYASFRTFEYIAG